MPVHLRPVTAALLANLDLTKVALAKRTVKLDEAAFDQVDAMTLAACDRYLEEDLRDYTHCRTEVRWDMDGRHGTFDQLLWSPTTAKITDWKTTTGTFPPNYNDEHEFSWQTWLYLSDGREWLRNNLGIDPSIMEYRAISAPVADKPTTRTMPFQGDESVFKALVSAQGYAIRAAYWGLEKAQVWPKALPYQCHKGSRGGATCEYWEDCTRGTTPLVQITREQMEAAVPRRKSDFGRFQDCNERYRRGVVIGDGNGSDLRMSIGTAFGKAVEEIWNQAFDLKGNNESNV